MIGFRILFEAGCFLEERQVPGILGSCRVNGWMIGTICSLNSKWAIHQSFIYFSVAYS